MVLKFLESQGIAPKASHFDNSKKHFDFDILIEEYLETQLVEMRTIKAKI
jgi:hypothetical protein